MYQPCSICEDSTESTQHIDHGISTEPLCLNCKPLYQSICTYLDKFTERQPPSLSSYISYSKRIAKNPNHLIEMDCINHKKRPPKFCVKSMITINESKLMNLVISNHTNLPYLTYIFHNNTFTLVDNKILSQALGVNLKNIKSIAKTIIQFSNITGAPFQIILNSYFAILNQKP